MSVANIQQIILNSRSVGKTRGYKIFGPNYTCRKYKYSLDKVNTQNGIPVPCFNGFHFCKTAIDCLNYYDFDENNTYAEVEGEECIEHEDKIATNKLTIIKTMKYEEFAQLLNGKFTKDYMVYQMVNGKLHGLAVSEDCYSRLEIMYDNGTPVYKSKYAKRYGIDEYTILLSHITCENGKDKKQIEYYNSGKIRAVNEYEGEFKHIKEYYENGTLLRDTTRKNGCLHSEYAEFHENGKPKIQEFYVDGVREGQCRVWDCFGNLVSDENYTNGHRDSVCKYYQKGKLSEFITYKNGEPYGLYKKYKNGYVEYDRTYWKLGSLHGPCTLYHSNGKPYITITYCKNQIVNYKQFDRKGVLLYECTTFTEPFINQIPFEIRSTLLH